MELLGTEISIEWHKFVVGTSMFIPCVHSTGVMPWLRKECDRMGMGVVMRPVISDGTFGIRVWRVF